MEQGPLVVAISDPWLPGDHLWGFPGESREHQTLNSDLGFSTGGFVLSQEMQNYPLPQQPGIIPGVSVGCVEKQESRMQSEMMAREGRE